ncbi:hypothetical protein DWQ65_07765 [Treponema phagedenis]|uniref:Lipoprotein n=2 Tax=Treponema phagedenis TaxID=162 RepID=A0A0B7GQ35_TREPH|nr:hypothetical protein [Treponema phagedenis]QEK06872.1 hypothetical protein FUT80_09225 [Treponema phagedenis]QSH93755.1 hypothetical protein C5O78_01540 [Treponema phagedenis]QSH99957.1 hypothetical protein DWQ65_07765 [Treponema phagedenis]CEM60704.1 conserved hypothetical protein [Treponema phagedenis]
MGPLDKKHRYFYVLFGIVIPVFFSCASTRFNRAAFDKAFHEKDYQLCVKMLQKKSYGKENNVLKYVDIGAIAHYAKDYQLSSKNFNEGDRLLDEGDLRSIAQFESFYLNILNSLNYYHMGKLEDAVVEIKKVDDEKVKVGRESRSSLWFIKDESSKVDLIRGFDSDERPSVQEQEAFNAFGIEPEQISKEVIPKPTEADLYRGSPTAYYLGALMRNANGDTEGARLSKDYLKVLNPQINIDMSLKRESGMASLNVLAFSGFIAKKEERVFYYPPEHDKSSELVNGKTITVAGTPFKLPPMRFKAVYTVAGENVTKVKNIRVALTDTETGATQTYPLTLLEDFGVNVKKNVALKARKEFQAKFAAGVAKKLTVTIISATAIIAARRRVQQEQNGFLKTLAQIALDIAEESLPLALEKIDAAIRADTRQAAYLPATVSVANIRLKPGTYNVKICYLGDNMVVYEEVFDNVQVQERGLNLLESLCLE